MLMPRFALFALLLPTLAVAKPVHVAVVLDTGKDLRTHKVVDAAADFLARLGGDPGDLAGAWEIAAPGEPIAPMTSMIGADKTFAVSTVRGVRTRRAKRELAVAIDTAGEYITALSGIRAVRAVVLIAGPDSGPPGTLEASTQRLSDKGVTVHVVAVGKKAQSLADAGLYGLFYAAPSKGDLPAVLARVFKNLERARAGQPPLTGSRPAASEPTEQPTKTAPAPPAAPAGKGLICKNEWVQVMVRRGGQAIRVQVQMLGKEETRKKLFQAAKARDITQVQKPSLVDVAIPAGDCKFSPTVGDVLRCHGERPNMFDLTAKGARHVTLLAGWVGFSTNRVERTTLDGNQTLIEARLDLGLNDTRAKADAKPQIGATALHTFKLSECKGLD